MKRCPSPNFNDRATDIPLRFIVLHYTDMVHAQEALTRLCDPQAQVSAHYLIDETGEVHALVDEERRAWHAGKSFWRGVTDMNSASIGIELANPGHSNGYTPFPSVQIAALKDLLRDIAARQGVDPRTGLLGHSDIAPARKTDPGELFPWKELAAEGWGIWPTADAVNTPSDARSLLAEIGYDTADLPAALRAFQRRFRPRLIDGTADEESLTLLHAVRNAMRG